MTINFRLVTACLRKALFLIALPACLHQNLQAKESQLLSVHSPDKRTIVQWAVNDKGRMVYRLFCYEKEVLAWSPVGLTVDGTDRDSAVVALASAVTFHQRSFGWNLGENRRVNSVYNEALLQCHSGVFRFNVRIRVFDRSLAFRYELPDGADGRDHIISRELTAFNLAGPAIIYQYNQESIFSPVPVSRLEANCDFPATLVTSNQTYLTIGEADNRQYLKAELCRSSDTNGVRVSFSTDNIRKGRNPAAGPKTVVFKGMFASPWRTVSVASSAIGLHGFSDLNLRLTEGGEGASQDKIKPGKLIRAQLNTQSGLDCVDFAVRQHFQYVLFDAGWYGAEFRTSSDPMKYIPALDLPAVIGYGKKKGVGIILYINYVGLKAKLDSILPLYKSWGVEGLKFGFVDGLSQSGLSWLDSAIRKVNDYGFVLDIHDNYKPTGLSRRYPYLLTQEGIRGDENSPDAFHNTVLPFTRMLAGPADFTFCFPNSKNSFSKNLKVSKGQQLALTVILFSPLQSIFWYGQPNDYKDDREIAFFRDVPTVWDESHYIAGDIGLGITVARRKGKTWFLGSAAGLSGWDEPIKLSFLERGKVYKATVYEDDGNDGIRSKEVFFRKGDTLPLALAPKTGQAIILEPR